MRSGIQLSQTVLAHAVSESRVGVRLAELLQPLPKHCIALNPVAPGANGDQALQRTGCVYHCRSDLRDNAATIGDAPDCAPDEMLFPDIYRAQVDLNFEFDPVLTASAKQLCDSHRSDRGVG